MTGGGNGFIVRTYSMYFIWSHKIEIEWLVEDSCTDSDVWYRGYHQQLTTVDVLAVNVYSVYSYLLSSVYLLTTV